MSEFEKEEIEKFMQKYKAKLEESLGTLSKIPENTEIKPIRSREYNEFKKEYLPAHLNLYEKWCNLSEKILKISPNEKKAEKISAEVNVCHLNVTPTGVTSFATLTSIAVILLGFVVSLLVPLLISVIRGTLFEPKFFFLFFAFGFGIALYLILLNLPAMFAQSWRMKASNQMVICIFYIVTYMRHTSNLENALNFAAEHIQPPLSLDLKKVIWDVETEKYDSVKEALDDYLESWRDYSPEFVDAMHLVESSIYETTEERRIEMLDKALDVILTETYEKMLHFAHDLRSPITMLHMLGVVLPVLGLVILPLIVSFMPSIKWYHIAMIYDVLLPLMVFYLGKKILMTRPTGYGESNLTKFENLKEKSMINFKLGNKVYKIKPAYYAFTIFLVIFLIGISPLVIHLISPDFDICYRNTGDMGPQGLISTAELQTLKPNMDKGLCFMDYRQEIDAEGNPTGRIKGPYGLGAALLSFFIPLSIALGLGTYYSSISKEPIKIMERTKKLEDEFASALFQLGNRLGDGLPAEMAVDKVVEVMKDTPAGQFFSLVSSNIKRLGMGVSQAIFDPKVGAILYFPSSLIDSSMKVLVDSIKKGPLIAANALLNISKYIKEIHKVDERLKDILGEVISSMKSQINFLSPVISGIVVGISSMISTILVKLGDAGKMMSQQGGDRNIITSFFRAGITSYHFQIVVGIYLVLIVYVLTIIANGIENGSDSIRENYNLGKNVPKSTIFYFIVGFIVMMLFNLIAGSILSSVVQQ